MNQQASSALQPERHNRFLAIMAKVATRLNVAQNWEQAIGDVMPLVGSMPDVHRVSLNAVANISEPESATFSQHFEYQDQVLLSGRPQYQNLPLKHFSTRWISELQANRLVVDKPDNVSAEGRKIVKARGTQAFLLVPVHTEQGLWGWLGLASQHSQRSWSEDEMALFSTVAQNLGSTISRFEQARRLYESEAKFRVLYNRSFQLTGVLSPEGVITDSNETVCQALNMGWQEMQGQYIWDLPVWPDQQTRDLLRSAVAQAATGGIARREFLLRSGGQDIALDYSLTPVLDTAGRVTMLISEGRDITVQKQAEFQLRERVKELQCLYQLSREADLPGLELETYLQQVVERVPEAFQWPEHTTAVLEYAGRRYTGPGFVQSAVSLKSEIRPQGEARGYLQLCLKPDCAPEQAFSQDEKTFLDEVCRIVTRVIDRLHVREELENRVKLRTRELQARETLMRHLINSLPDLVFYKDPEGRYLGCNRAYEVFTGKSEAELIGHRDAELFTEDWIREAWAREDWQHVFTVLENDFVPGEIQTREDWVYRREGPRVFLETRKMAYSGLDGELLGFIGISRDLTDRKLAENAMQENEAKIRQLIEGVPVGIFVMEASGNSYFANGTALELLGRGILPQGEAAEQLAPYKSFIAGTDEEYPQERNPLVRAFINKEKTEVSDIETLLPDGRRLPLYVTGAPILDEHNELMYAVAAFSDISEMRRKEAELIEARERAEAASRAKSDFLANMSHEIRTPMNAIIGLNHLLLKSELSGKQQEHVHKIQSAAQNLLGIINDILDFSKIEAGKLRMEKIPFDLQQVIVNLSNLLGIRAQEKALELIIHLRPNIPFALMGDPLRLEQVLLNLASNALKFTETGEVEISGEVLDENDEQVHLCFKVRDTGIGIAREHQTKLFQAFSQADSSTTRKYGGTGLGLMISKRLVEMMHGTIGFTSEEGQGSVFYFSAWFGKQLEKPTASLSAPTELKGLRALVVDDHQAVLDVARAYLESFHFELDLAQSGPKALAVIDDRQARGESYDLLLIDWQMPDMNGFELIGHCWERLPVKPRTLLMTAYGREDVFLQAEHFDLDGILLKPLTPSQVFDAVIQAFGGTQQLQTIASAEYAKTLDPVRGASLLLVEDNDINQLVARELLEAEGFRVTVTANGREAIDRLLNAEPDSYDLVLMDIHMPVMDGYEATRKLRELPRCKSLPVIAMTADAVTGIREQVLSAGMNDFVTKPIDLGELFNVLARWLKVREPAERGPRPDRQALIDSHELPPLPGVETREALLRLGGNMGLYIKLLRRFAEELPDKLQELANSLQAQEQAHAHQQSHTLKGTAGNLGLTGLQTRMASLEQALKAQDWPTAEFLLEQARIQLHPLLPEILSIQPLPQASQTALSPAEQAELRRKLTEALQNYDPSAGDLLAQLSICVEQPELCQELEILIDDFDFETALLRWLDLQKELEQELEKQLDSRVGEA